MGFLENQKAKQEHPPAPGGDEVAEEPASAEHEPGAPLTADEQLEKYKAARERIEELEAENRALKLKVRNLNQKLARKNIGRR